MFDPTIASIRFGMGLSPTIAPPASIADMIETLAGPDEMARVYPMIAFQDLIAGDDTYRDYQAISKKQRGTPEAEQAKADAKALLTQFRRQRTRAIADKMARAALTRDGFRERLTGFWADHFTARGKGAILQYGVDAYIEEAIRPHLSGRFADMLKTVVPHPMMLVYLDQSRSVGDNSKIGLKRANRGLNENLAREVLELHTLGVGAPYDQTDVRQLAELFTGMTVRRGEGFLFHHQIAEPGAETVLGREYGGDPPRLAHIHKALEDLARHPATAAHLARKLAVHFVSDAPDPALISAIETAYLDSDGHLLAAYQAMLGHPAAWDPEKKNVKWPAEFIGSTMRALGVTGDQFSSLTMQQKRRIFEQPISRMGQNWNRPPGPDGWPEEDNAWITPQGIAARISWAMELPKRLGQLPDPRAFLDKALGAEVPQALRFVVSASETKAEGFGLILASPSFQRR